MVVMTAQQRFADAWWQTAVAGVCMAAERNGLGWAIYTDWEWEYNWT